jgi:hypothetical protein
MKQLVLQFSFHSFPYLQPTKDKTAFPDLFPREGVLVNIFAIYGHTQADFPLRHRADSNDPMVVSLQS